MRDTGFRNKNKGYIYACLAGVIVIFMYLALLLVSHITPFGDNTWIMYDLKRQYIDFYSYYKRLFTGQTDILYSFETALGSGMIGFIIYYLSNPFFLLFNLFDIRDLPNAVTLVIGLTLVAGAFLMALFLSWFIDPENKKGSSADDPIKDHEVMIKRGFAVITGSVAWAFGGFLIAHSMNMMWTDVVIMLPVLIYAVERIIRDDRSDVRSRVIYVITLSVMLIMNYYITYQALLYVALWTLVRLWSRSDKHPVRKIRDVAICTIISVLLDAVVLLPTLLELANSPKDITKLGMEATGRMLSPLDVFSKAFVMAYDVVQPRSGFPQIYAGVLILIPAILFFLEKKYPLKDRIGRLILLLILLLSFCIDQINLFWHALMEPSGHPYRQAPLFVFTLILCAVTYMSGTVRPEGEDNIRVCRIRYIILFFIMEIVLASVMLKGYEYTGKKMFLTNECLIIAGTAGFYALERIGRGTLSKMIIMGTTSLLLIELLLNAVFTYPFLAMNGEKMSTYRNKIDPTRSAVQQIKDMDNGFYRMENLTPRQQNDSMMFGYNGVTHYSSAGMTYVRYLLQKAGYNDDTLYTHYGHDNTVTMDMLLGIRYVLTEDEQLVHHGYSRIDMTEGAVSAYRNPYALPVAIAVKDYDLDGITDIDDPGTIKEDPFALQEDMVSRLTGHRTEIFTPLDQDIEISDSSMEAVLTAVREGEVYMYLDGIMDKVQGLAVYVEDELLTGYGNLGCYKILNLGYHDTGDSIHIRIDSDTDSADFGEPLFMTENMDSVKASYDEMIRNGLEMELITPSSVRIGGIPENAGIFTTIPCEKGWNIGKTDIYGALMYIPPDEIAGNELTLRFVPAGMYPGGVISLITLVFCLGYIMAVCIGQKQKQAQKA